MRLQQTKKAPALTIPVRGVWWLPRTPGHDRYTYDMVAVDSDSHRALAVSRVKHLLGGATASDSHGWGRPVFAPIGGVVADSSDGWPDRERLHLFRDIVTMLLSPPELRSDDVRPFAGNFVILRSEKGCFALLAHLQSGSIAVSAGDTVTCGQKIGRVGNSGFTLEPHLHFQLVDQIDDLVHAESQKFCFDKYLRWTGKEWKTVIRQAPDKGDLIRLD